MKRSKRLHLMNKDWAKNNEMLSSFCFNQKVLVGGGSHTRLKVGSTERTDDGEPVQKC